MTRVRLIVLLFGVAAAAPSLAQAPAPLLVDAAWLAQHINDRNLVVLHVDDEADYKAGHLPGALSFPLGRLAESLDRLPRGRTLVVHCQMGGRAAVAAALLKARGFGDVVHLAGDFAGWQAAGRPVESGEAVPA